MDPLVSLQVFSAAEAFPALVAVVGLFARVDLLVFFQVSRLTEAPPTLRAAVRLFPRVTALVDSQVPDPAERLPAHGAQVEVAASEELRPDLSPVKFSSDGFGATLFRVI